jgi:hypothetical protein
MATTDTERNASQPFDVRSTAEKLLLQLDLSLCMCNSITGKDLALRSGDRSIALGV